MKKMNKKGFMLLETMVVSAFITTVLVYLYVQFSNLKRNYETSFKYDSVDGLYAVREIDKYVNGNFTYSSIVSTTNSLGNNYIIFYTKTNGCSNYIGGNNNTYSTYCNNLMGKLKVKTVLFVNSKIKDDLSNIKTNYPSLYLYLKHANFKKLTNKNYYYVVAEFEDNTYASLQYKSSSR